MRWCNSIIRHKIQQLWVGEINHDALIVSFKEIPNNTNNCSMRRSLTLRHTSCPSELFRLLHVLVGQFF